MPRLGELLVEENRISPEQLDYALYFQAVHGGRLGRNLIRLGFATEEQVTAALARKYGIPSVDLERVQVSPSVLRLLPLEQAIRYRSLPISRNRKALQVAMADPNDVAAVNEIQFLTGCTIRPVLAPETSLVTAIYEQFGRSAAKGSSTNPTSGAPAGSAMGDLRGQIVHGDTSTPVIDACNKLLLRAVRWNASDIHVERYLDSWRIRFRIDGTLHTVVEGRTPASGGSKARAAINRFRRMAQLAPAETSLPQEGRLSFRSGSAESEKDFEFDVFWMSLLFGEKLVLRRVYRDPPTERSREPQAKTGRGNRPVDPYPGWTREQKESALNAVARRGDTRTVQLCLRAGADPTAGTGGYPPLWAAVQSGNVSTVQALIAGGAHLRSQLHDRTMLRTALEDGHADCVRAVLDARAALSDLSEDEWARQALETAASTGHRDLLKTLLERGVPLSKTVLLEAVAAGHVAIVSDLLALRESHTGCGAAIVAAAAMAHAEIVKLLLGAARSLLTPSDLDEALTIAVISSSPSKLWPAHWSMWWIGEVRAACKSKKKLAEYHQTVTLLLQAGANPNARGRIVGSGAPVLVLAAESGNAAVLRTLIASGAGVNVTSDGGWSPLTAAIEGRYTQSVRALLEAGAEVTADALRRITSPGRVCSLQALTKLGSTVRWNRADLNDALRWAEQQGHSDIVELLFKAGAHEEIEREVREKIIDAFKARVKSLDLSRHSLKTLPAEIGLLSELESLDLNYNYLSELPAELARLSNLRTLELTGNQLTDLPKPIYSLQKLETLDVAGNPLKSGLQEAMSKLTALRMLITDSGPSIRKPSAPTQAGRNDHLASDKLSSTQSSVEATPSQRKPAAQAAQAKTPP